MGTELKRNAAGPEIFDDLATPSRSRSTNRIRAARKHTLKYCAPTGAISNVSQPSSSALITLPWLTDGSAHALSHSFIPL